MDGKSRRKRLELATETLLTLTPADLAQADGGLAASGECWTERMPCTEKTLQGCSLTCYSFCRC